MVRPNVMMYNNPAALGQQDHLQSGGGANNTGNNEHSRLQLRSIPHARQSELFCMVWNRAWEDVVRRANNCSSNSSRAHELDVVDETTGNTLLHEACRLDCPPEVVRALSKTCRVQNHQGATPLHIAASHRCSVPALRVLLDCASRTPRYGMSSLSSLLSLSPSPTADLSNMGRAPIHYACMSFRGLEIDAFLLLLDETLQHGNLLASQVETMSLGLDDDDDDDDLDDDLGFDSGGELGEEAELYASFGDNFIKDATLNANHYNSNNNNNNKVVNVMSMKDALGQTPLALLFRRYRQRVRSVIRTVDRINHESPKQAALVSALTVRAELGELWEKARRIVARLTKERLVRDAQQQQQQDCKNDINAAGLRSPGEAAVHQEAASWAAEQHNRGQGGRRSGVLNSEDEDVLPVYVEAAASNSGASDREQSVSPLPSSQTAAATTADGMNNMMTATTAVIASKCRPFRIVHASVGLIGYGCPPEMIRLAISIHPHQVREMDEDGNLPLHIAVKASSYLATCAAATAIAAEQNHNNMADDLSVLSDAMSFFSTATISQTENPFDKVIKILLQHYPQGARIPHGKTGELPLVMAIESGCRTWDDGIRTLLNAYPPALHNKRLLDPLLYPNVLALVSTGSSTSNDSDDANNNIINGSRHGNLFGGSLHSANNDNTETMMLPRLMPPSSTHLSRSKKRRQDACARTTLFELIRSKPEWLTAQGRNDEECDGQTTRKPTIPRRRLRRHWLRPDPNY